VKDNKVIGYIGYSDIAELSSGYNAAFIIGVNRKRNLGSKDI